MLVLINKIYGRARWGISGALLPAIRYSRIDARVRLFLLNLVLKR